ncbi:hypothetical protein D915_008602 [Fasciola hepatica]|uniref:Coiled-coil domain-containing protein 153 n=1 Tax=Fasciola hepatica TaxID=6192 RepID=A0A2H1BZL0_FASHE|nr:hypothetical protein D915_008602 [Fasciola hepatica]
MSKRISSKRRSKSSKRSDPANEALERSRHELSALRQELSRTLYIADTKSRRSQSDRLAKTQSARTLEDLRQNTQEQTAYVVTQHEMIVSSLSEKIDKLEEQLERLNKMVNQKDDTLEKLKKEYSETLSERDSTIDRLRKQLSTEGAQYEDTMIQAFNRITNTLGDDYLKFHENFQLWSEETMKKIELEFLNPPFLDEDSTVYY